MGVTQLPLNPRVTTPAAAPYGLPLGARRNTIGTLMTIPDPAVHRPPEDESAAALAEAQQAARQLNAGHDLQSADRAWFFGYLITALSIFTTLLGLNQFPDSATAVMLAPFRGYFRGALAMVAVLGVVLTLDVYLVRRIPSAASQHNLRRIIRLATVLVLGLILLSAFFANWYSAFISFGVLSLVLGFALQTPITSLIGWVYILVRVPYRVGDRIQMGAARGDVIDVGYFDTTLWEFGGDYLSGDHPSGRIIKFPNAQVLNEPVFNYSWPLFPYIWHEIKLNIAYQSDLEFVATTMQNIATEVVGAPMKKKVAIYRQLIAQTPVNELDVNDKPSVLFRVSENTWIEAIVRYLVHPKEAGKIKTRLTIELLKQLNAAPDKVMFPAGSSR